MEAVVELSMRKPTWDVNEATRAWRSLFEGLNNAAHSLRTTPHPELPDAPAVEVFIVWNPAADSSNGAPATAEAEPTAPLISETPAASNSFAIPLPSSSCASNSSLTPQYHMPPSNQPILSQSTVPPAPNPAPLVEPSVLPTPVSSTVQPTAPPPPNLVPLHSTAPNPAPPVEPSALPTPVSLTVQPTAPSPPDLVPLHSTAPNPAPPVEPSAPPTPVSLTVQPTAPPVRSTRKLRRASRSRAAPDGVSSSQDIELSLPDPTRSAPPLHHLSLSPLLSTKTLDHENAPGHQLMEPKSADREKAPRRLPATAPATDESSALSDIEEEDNDGYESEDAVIMTSSKKSQRRVQFGGEESSEPGRKGRRPIRKMPQRPAPETGNLKSEFSPMLFCAFIMSL
jgi:hypothetical protein